MSSTAGPLRAVQPEDAEIRSTKPIRGAKVTFVVTVAKPENHKESLNCNFVTVGMGKINGHNQR